MPEAITKYAINSSLGKSNFVPIDVLIRNQLVLYASDNLHRGLLTEIIPCYYKDNGTVAFVPSNGGTAEATLPIHFEAINNGTCNIKFKLTHTRTNTNDGCSNNSTSVKLLKNNTVYKTSPRITEAVGIDTPHLVEYTSFNDVSFSAGDKFTMSVSTTNNNLTYESYVYLLEMGIYGDITPGIFLIE